MSSIILYSPQARPVTDAIEQNGISFSRREYVARKYGESAPIFLAAYDWFVREAAKYVPIPAGAEYPYWAFPDPRSVDGSAGNPTLTLRVPLEEAVFFSLYDWNRILCLQYIGSSPQDEADFRETIRAYGIRRESDIILTGFYPDLKQTVMQSWSRLFRYDGAVKAGQHADLLPMQAGLWCLKKEWIQHPL